jgi:hypothetical protein
MFKNTLAELDRARSALSAAHDVVHEQSLSGEIR